MAKTYRTLKFEYGTTTEQIDVRLTLESVEREDLETIRQAADGTRYSYVTGYKRRFEYEYDYADNDVYNFFANGYNAFNGGQTVRFYREQDDGSFESFPVIIRRPQFRDETISSTSGEKVYADVSVEVLEI